MMQGNINFNVIIVAMVTIDADNILVVLDFILLSVLWLTYWVLLLPSL